ncbi:hypothetical protein [Aerosakkonema funiforme]|uniref:hypothetical protein n=1 Tax=Aerosakkonema funiforme TaxID=1246630 RepID=UPI0035BA86EE
MHKILEDVVLRESTAEKALSEHLPRIACIYARLSRNISITGPLKYALDMERRYAENSYQETFSATHNLLWVAAWIVVSLMVSRAPYAASAGLPDDLRWPLAFVVSLVLTFFVEWAIATYIKAIKCHRDEQSDRAEIAAKYQKAGETGNRLIFDRAESNQMVFDEVKSSYRYRITKWSIAVTVILLVIEYLGSLYYIANQGEEGDWITYIVPLVGIFLTALSALYTGDNIEYPKARGKISLKYGQYAAHLEKEKPEELKREIHEFYVLEGLTIFVVENPVHDRLQRQQEEARLRHQLVQEANQRRCHQLHEEYQQIKQACLQEITALKEEEMKRSKTITDTDELRREIQARALLIYQKYATKMEPLEREMKERNCPLDPPAWKISNGNSPKVSPPHRFELGS